jgi:hypothetical protein
MEAPELAPGWGGAGWCAIDENETKAAGAINERTKERVMGLRMSAVDKRVECNQRERRQRQSVVHERATNAERTAIPQPSGF